MNRYGIFVLFFNETYVLELITNVFRVFVVFCEVTQFRIVLNTDFIYFM